MSSKELKPVRILQMIASFTRGGSQSLVMNLYRNIDRSKIQFDFIVDHTEYSGYENEIKQLGGNIFVMPSFKGTNIKEIKSAWNNFFDEHPEYKILHSHSRSYASLYLPIARKHGVKTIIHSHSTSNGNGFKAVVKNILQFPLRYQADYYLACSLAAGKWLFGNKIVKSNKFYILNNAIDAKKYVFNEETRKEYRNKFNIKNDESVYIQIGNFIPTKNYEFSIECFNKLLSIKPNSRFYIVGTGSDESISKLKEQISMHDLDDKVVLLGTRNDVNLLLQMADYYLMPSKYEGISLAAIEAQASDINCILSDRVSKDMKIIEKCKYVSLNEGAWIKEMSINNFVRKNNLEELINSGYDINDASRWLESFYRGIYNE